MGSGIEDGIWISTHLTKRKGTAKVTNVGSGAAVRQGQPRPQGAPGLGGTLLPSCVLNAHLGPAEAPSTKSSEPLPPGLRRPAGTFVPQEPCFQEETPETLRPERSGSPTDPRKAQWGLAPPRVRRPGGPGGHSGWRPCSRPRTSVSLSCLESFHLKVRAVFFIFYLHVGLHFCSALL